MVIEVLDSRMQEKFLNLSRLVYQGDLAWFPELQDHISPFLKAISPYSGQCHSKALVVLKGEDVVGRIFAQIDQQYNEHWQEKMGHLLFFEALPDSQAEVSELFESSLKWLKGMGCNMARMSYLHARQLPLTIDSYNQVPTMFHSYSPPYYHAYIKNAGFSTEKGLSEGIIPLAPVIPKAINILKQSIDRGITIRPLDTNSSTDIRTFLNIHNEAFQKHWGASMLNFSQAEDLLKGMKDQIFELLKNQPSEIVQKFSIDGLIQLAEMNGKALGFNYSLPNFYEAFHYLHHNQVTLDKALNQIGNALYLLMGICENGRGLGLANTLTSSGLIELHNRGFKNAIYSMYLDDNLISRKILKKFNGKTHRCYVAYSARL